MIESESYGRIFIFYNRSRKDVSVFRVVAPNEFAILETHRIPVATHTFLHTCHTLETRELALWDERSEARSINNLQRFNGEITAEIPDNANIPPYRLLISLANSRFFSAISANFSGPWPGSVVTREVIWA